MNLWCIYHYVQLCVSLGDSAVALQDLDCVCQSIIGKNVYSLSSPPLPQHVGLCVCEDSSCILRSRSRGKHLPLSPDSTSSSSSCPHLTLMAVGFLMRKWVSLCSVPMEDLGGWAGGGEWCTGAKHIPRLWSSNTRLAGWDRGGHSLSKYCHALLQPSKSKTSQPQHSACLALLSAQWTGTRHYGNRHACVKLLGFVNQKGCCKQYTMVYFFVSLIIAMWELSCLIRSTTKDWVDWKKNSEININNNSNSLKQVLTM